MTKRTKGIIAVVAVLAAAFLLWMGLEHIHPDLEEQSGFFNDEYPAFESIEEYDPSPIVISISKSRFVMGESGVVDVVVRCSPEIQGDIVVTDESGEVVLTLDNNGSGILTENIALPTDRQRFSTLKAVSEGCESPEIEFIVMPKIMPDQMETLMDVCADLGKHIVTDYADDVYADDLPAQLAEWLAKDTRVAHASVNDRTVLFTTRDGLVGGYNAEKPEPYTFSGFDSVDDAFSRQMSGGDVSDIVLDSKETYSNSQFMFLSPLPEDDIVHTFTPFQLEAFTGLYDAVRGDFPKSALGRENPLYKEGLEAEKSLLSGEFGDCGVLLAVTHGVKIYESDRKTQMLLLSVRDMGEQSKTLGLERTDNSLNWYQEMDKSEKELFLRELTKFEVSQEEAAQNLKVSDCTGDYYGTDEKPEFCDRILLVKADENDSKDRPQTWSFSAQITGRALERGLGNRMLDNTVVIFIVCHSNVDKHFRQCLLDHGAAAFFGCNKPLNAYTSIASLELMTRILGEKKKDGTYGTLNEVKEAKISNKEHKKVREVVKRLIPLLDDSDGEEPDEKADKKLEDDIYKSYKKALKEEQTLALTIRSDLEKRALAGSSVFSGIVTDDDGEPVGGVSVTGYRWMNHSFEEAFSVSTDEKGRYQRVNLPFGIYAVSADNGMASGYVTHVFYQGKEEADPIVLHVDNEDLYYKYLNDTYGTGESDLVSAYIMDFDLDGRKDLLTVTKGRVILANTPLGAFDLYDGETEAATLDLTMYQLDEENNVVKTGAILGAGTIEGHSEGKMSVSIVLQDGKPYICGYSENEDNTTYGARPYVIYEVIEGGGFQYDYVDGISWGQYVMGTTDNKDPNKVAKTYGLDITGTQLSDRANYGVVLCEATANNRQGPGPIVANDYTGVKEGMENGYEAVKNQLDAIHELMVLNAQTFEERQESAKDTEGLFEVFANELSAAGITPVLKEYRTKEDIVLGIYKCQDVDMYVSIENGSGKLTEIELMADGFPVPDSWYPVKDAVLDQTKIGEVLGHTPANFSVYGLDAGPAKILAGNTDTIVLRISY